MNLTTLPSELEWQIALNVDYFDLPSFCKSSAIFRTICKDPRFWQLKAEHNFNITPSEFSQLPGSTPRIKYAIAYANMLHTQKYSIDKNYGDEIRKLRQECEHLQLQIDDKYNSLIYSIDNLQLRLKNDIQQSENQYRAHLIRQLYDQLVSSTRLPRVFNIIERAGEIDDMFYEPIGYLLLEGQYPMTLETFRGYFPDNLEDLNIQVNDILQTDDYRDNGLFYVYTGPDNELYVVKTPGDYKWPYQAVPMLEQLHIENIDDVERLYGTPLDLTWYINSSGKRIDLE